jgi:hypothetical protein
LIAFIVEVSFEPVFWPRRIMKMVCALEPSANYHNSTFQRSQFGL